MEFFRIVLQQIIIFIIYASMGVALVKTKILNLGGLNELSKVITKVALPLLVFTNTINGATREQFVETGSVLVAACIMYIILFALFYAITGSGIFPMTGNEKNVYQACSALGNNGFMGIPIVTALFPEKGMLYMAIFTVVDQFLLWTYGVDKTSPVDGQSKRTVAQRVKKMINPSTVGLALAMVLVFTKIQIPVTINAALTKMGACATPMAMLYLGGTFCYTNFGATFRRKELYATILLKMCVMPVILSFVLPMVPGVSNEIALLISVLCAMPAMSSLAMLAQQQGSAGEYGAGMIFETTLFSAITIPIVCLIIS